MFHFLKPNATPNHLTRDHTDAGIFYSAQEHSGSAEIWLSRADAFGSGQQALVTYLSQLEEEGHAEISGVNLLLPWRAIYRLCADPAHESSLPLLGLPPESLLLPVLASRGSLADAGFRIYLSGWKSPTATPLQGEVRRIGAVVHHGQPAGLLPESVWRLVEAVREFSALPEAEKNQYRNQRAWGRSQPDYVRGCIVADDMGLGKSLQLLTFVAHLLESAPDSEAVLIVAPVSLLDNWRNEMEKFFRPGFANTLTLYGKALANLKVPRQSIDAQLTEKKLTHFLKPGWRGNAQIVLTTYETLRDLEFSLAAEKWSVMICDEAQKIKTPHALVTQAAKAQNARFKIACTGTPVENSLTDLWCLFDFVQAGLLGPLNQFSQQYRKPIEAKTEQELQAIESLRQIIAPQILRRTKQEVAKDLPPKIEDTNCKALPISQIQRQLYFQAIEIYRKKLDEMEGNSGAGIALLAMIHHLRAICADPKPMGMTSDLALPLHQHQMKSPKIKWLMEKLAEIEERGEKVILFSEFRDIQRLLQHYIGQRFGCCPVVINGDTSANSEKGLNRQSLIDQFQRLPGFGVIILSTVAIGFGVNIQAANHVIHFTRPWNPAKEDQATDRAYRIGQTRTVTVYYPTVVAEDFDTFEARLDNLLATKRKLAGDMLNGADELTFKDFSGIPGVAV